MVKNASHCCPRAAIKLEIIYRVLPPNSGPWTTIKVFLCDRYGSTWAPDSPDSSGLDGHRKNLMRTQYMEIGTGYAEETTDDWSRISVVVISIISQNATLFAN